MATTLAKNTAAEDTRAPRDGAPSGEIPRPAAAKASLDPLAPTDRYRWVVPFAADPRRLSDRRPEAPRAPRA